MHRLARGPFQALLLVSIAFRCSYAQPLPVVFQVDDAEDGTLKGTDGTQAAHDAHLAENVPLTIHVIPCGEDSTSDPFVCRNGAFHENYARWERENPGVFEAAQHGLTHDEHLGRMTRAEQHDTILLGLQEMETWGLPAGRPFSFSPPFASWNAATVAELESLGFHSMSVSSGGCPDSSRLSILCQGVPLCERDASGKLVEGPACVIRSASDVLAEVDDRAAFGRVLVLYHVQDLFNASFTAVDSTKVSALRSVLRAARARELAGRYDLMTQARLYQIFRAEPGPAPVGELARIDFGGNGDTDVSVFRPSERRWFVDFDFQPSVEKDVVYGRSGDFPVPSDYDGDGITDFAVFRPSTATWFVDSDRNGGTDLRVVYGRSGDVPVPGDYNGDDRGDIAVYRPSTGNWFVDTNYNGGTDIRVAFGGSARVPVPADYDGDGRTDFATFQQGRWRIDLNADGVANLVLGFGTTGDIPLPQDYDGDGKADLAVFRPSTGTWFVDTGRDGLTDAFVDYGRDGDVPTPGDYNGDRRADIAVFRPSTSRWFVDLNFDGGTDLRVLFGLFGDVPLRQNGWILDAFGLTR